MPHQASCSPHCCDAVAFLLSFRLVLLGHVQALWMQRGTSEKGRSRNGMQAASHHDLIKRALITLQSFRCPGAPEWPQGQVVPVRESLALSTTFFFRLAPQTATHLFAMWDQASAHLSVCVVVCPSESACLIFKAAPAQPHLCCTQACSLCRQECSDCLWVCFRACIDWH